MLFFDENVAGDFGRNPCVLVVFHEIDENVTEDFGRNPCVLVVFHEVVAGIRVCMVFFDESAKGF